MADLNDTTWPDFARGIVIDGSDPLLPVITQDASSGEVLMLAWINDTALRQSIAQRRAVYYSRSRRELWAKGDTSGHIQRLIEWRIDCDADAILFEVEQTGAACHEGYRSCFFRRFDAQSNQFATVGVKPE